MLSLVINWLQVPQPAHLECNAVLLAPLEYCATAFATLPAIPLPVHMMGETAPVQWTLLESRSVLVHRIRQGRKMDVSTPSFWVILWEVEVCGEGNDRLAKRGERVESCRNFK